MKKYCIYVTYWDNVKAVGPRLNDEWKRSIWQNTVTRYANGLKEARSMVPAKVSWNHNMKAFWGFYGATECIIKEA